MVKLNSRPRAEVLNAVGRRAAEKSIGKQERVRRLWKLADTWAEVVAPMSGCKKGCAHCCHIPVTMFESEAKTIGAAIKVAPADLGKGMSGPREEFGYHMPCPFLKPVAGRADSPGMGYECGIYETRPLACRLHFNLDVDELLCELHPEMAAEGAVVPVPCMAHNEIDLQVASTLAGEPLADIRDWFPDGSARGARTR